MLNGFCTKSYNNLVYGLTSIDDDSNFNDWAENYSDIYCHDKSYREFFEENHKASNNSNEDER